MTQLVVDAERRGELPPTRISPCKLQQQRQQPTLSELRAAFGLYRLSRAFATSIYPHDEPLLPLSWWDPPEHPDRIAEWIACVSHAMFRLLILGAALAGAYKEPLLKALEHPDPEVKALLQRVPQHYSDADWRGVESLGQKEMAFLLQFAVCDLGATLEAQDAVFGPIAEWLLDSILSDKESRQAMADRFERGYGRAEFCLSRDEDDGPCPARLLPDGRGSHSDAHLVVWELMKMFWLAEEVRPHGLQGSKLDRRAPRSPSTHNGGLANENNRDPVESVVAVFFGMFRAEETLLPTPTPTDGPRWRLITHPAVPETREGDTAMGSCPGA